MASIKQYLSLVKFSHTIFAMPFAMIGFFLAMRNTCPQDWGVQVGCEGISTYQKAGLFFQFKWEYFVLIILCMVFARSAAMAFNRYLDRSFDAKNPRTAIREIPAGIITANSALLFTLISCSLFLVSAFFINPLCFYLSPLALFVVLGYSYTKRFTSFCHLILGLGLSLAPIGAYLAVTAAFAWLPLLFSFTVIFWVSGFDIIYALQDEEFDKANQLFSVPAALGKKKALRVSELLHLLSALMVAFAGIYGGFGWWYWIGVLVFMGMLLYQHSLVNPSDLSRVNLAFMTANGIASVVFAVFVITDIFLSRL